jgi:hypothetical protein
MIDQALISLRPGAVWTLNGFEYSGLDWRDEVQTKPTEEEINVEIDKIAAEEITKKQDAINLKESAVAKLTALGLTMSEITALGIK